MAGGCGAKPDAMRSAGVLWCLVFALRLHFAVAAQPIVVDFIDIFPKCAQYPGTGVTERFLLVVKNLPVDPERMPLIQFKMGALTYLVTKTFLVNQTDIHLKGGLVDFRKYEYMEINDNLAFNKKYNASNLVFLEWVQSVPSIDARKPQDKHTAFSLSVVNSGLNYPMMYTWTVPFGNTMMTLSQPRLFYIYDVPKIDDWFPMTGPSQGGTRISVKGTLPFSHHPSMPVIMPLIKISTTYLVRKLDPTGYETNSTEVQDLYIKVSVGPKNATFYTLPQMLNQTDATLNATISISYNRQTWYKITGPEEDFVYVDPTRLAIDNVVSIASMRERRLAARRPGQAGQSRVLTAAVDRMRTGRREHPVGLVPDMLKDANKFWVIRPAHGKSVPAGTGVLCGETIRLTHHNSMKNLHAWFSDSQVSHQQEVTIFGHLREGDDGDNWVVYCEPNTEHAYAKNWQTYKFDVDFHRKRFSAVVAETNKYWRRDTPFRLWHPNSNSWLNFADEPISAQLCPSCAKQKMTEVSSAAHPFHGNEPSFRWYIKQSLSVVFECIARGEFSELRPGHLNWVRSKSWARFHRPMRVHDFVAWRTLSSMPCENIGPTRIGQITQLFEETQIVEVEEWQRVSPKYNYIRRYASFLPDEVKPVALTFAQVYGPLMVRWEDVRADAHSRVDARSDLRQVMPKWKRSTVKLFINDGSPVAQP